VLDLNLKVGDIVARVLSARYRAGVSPKADLKTRVKCG
jgi:hypothetical protein